MTRECGLWQRLAARLTNPRIEAMASCMSYTQFTCVKIQKIRVYLSYFGPAYFMQDLLLLIKLLYYGFSVPSLRRSARVSGFHFLNSSIRCYMLSSLSFTEAPEPCRLFMLARYRPPYSTARKSGLTS